VVAGDFNKDGNLDLALDDGVSIGIFLGKGDGTFTPASGYATINNTGYLSGTDLDGDGNTDLYSGVMRGGAFGGDQFEINQAYALMGNGDGTFRGAPEIPFAFTGTNLIDLNGDHIPDGVGVDATINSSNVSMTSYLGSSNGSFTAKQTFQISPVTISGTPLSFQTLDSFGLGDVTGDGNADVVYEPSGFNGPGGHPGYFLATGNGDGTFGTPVWIQGPSLVPSGDTDFGETITGLFVADVNGDGKADLIYSYSDEDFQTLTYYQGIAIQLSTGSGNFAAPQAIQTYKSTTAPTELPPFIVQLGHTRAGGPLDLFTETEINTSGTITYELQLYLGNGDGTFGAPSTPKVADDFTPPSFGSELAPLVLADMNGDGKPDLITLGTSSTNQGELAIALGNGDGTFQAPTILDFGFGSTIGYALLAAADFNGDGKVDIAVGGFNPPIDTGIFLGNGDGTVQSFSPSSGLVEPAEGIGLVLFGAGGVADFNGDGKPDLVSGSAVLINLGAASTLVPTTTTVTASGTSVTQGTTVTLTATVSASSTPTGSVTFNDGNTALATVALNGSGVAMYSTNALSVGVHSITAAYAANSTFASSTSPAVAITVTAPVTPSFTIAASPTGATVTAGNSATTMITVTPAGGFDAQVSFACTGLPTGGTCSFSPPTVTPNGTAAATTTLTIATTTASGALRMPWRPGSRSGGAATLAVLAAGAVWIFGRKKKVPWIHMMPLMVVLLATAAVAVGCGGGGNNGGGGGGGGSTPQTYTVTITGTAGSENEPTTFALTVN
jgi:Bacterial Ig-like domain (group 3)/FG-GAP-like repeat